MPEAARRPRSGVPSGRLAALHNSHFRTLFVGGMFTFLAMQVGGIARAWLAFDLTGTNTGLGGVMLAFGLTSIVAIPVGGMLADRFPKRRVLVLAAAMQTLGSAVLGVAVATETVSYWLLVSMSLVQGAMISILAPARLAFIADVVPRRLITNAVFLSMSTVQMTRVIGPAAAGALIGVTYFGLAGVFLSAAAAGAVSLWMSLMLPAGKPTRTTDAGPLTDIVDGLRFVRSRPDVLHLLWVSFGVVLLGFPYVAFLPVVAENVHNTGSAGFGFLNATAAGGALVGSLLFANAQRRRMRPVQGTTALVFGISLAVFAIVPNFTWALIVMAVVGGSSSVFQALNNSLVLTQSPVEYHGRVQSLLMLSFSGFAIAALPIGILADAIGIRPTMVMLGLAVVAVVGVAKLTEPHLPQQDATL